MDKGNFAILQTDLIPAATLLQGSSPLCAQAIELACRLVLTVPAEHLKPGGASHHLLEQLYRCHVLSERAERQWGACSVEPAPAAGHYKSLLLVGIPFMVHHSCLPAGLPAARGLVPLPAAVFALTWYVDQEQLSQGSGAHGLIASITACNFVKILLFLPSCQPLKRCKSLPFHNLKLASICCCLSMQVQHWLEVLLSNGIIVDSQVDLDLTQMLLPKACPAPTCAEAVTVHRRETAHI